MDLTWTEREEAFRAEARGWLEVNVPRDLAAGDTRARLDWERRPYDARWAVVSWPEQRGGRDATLWEWLLWHRDRLAHELGVSS